MTRGGWWQKPDEIKRLNDTEQFYYTAEYQAGTQLFLLRVLCAILFWWHKNISSNDSKTSHLVLRSWVELNFSFYSYINGDITISRAAARELEYAMTLSYETKDRDMGWGLATYWGSGGFRGATIWLYCYGVGCVINNKWYPKWLNCVRILPGYELLRVRSLRRLRASQYCLDHIRSLIDPDK